MNRNREIVKSSSNMSNKPGIQSLTEALLNGSSMEARLQAAVRLVKSDDPAAIGLLVKAASDENPTFRAKLVKAISKLNYPVVTEMLIKGMYDADCYVRKTAIEAARDVDNPEIIEAIIACLNDEEINVRESAVLALENSRNTDLVIEVLSGTLADSNWNVRRESIAVIAKMGVCGSVEPLKKMLKDEDPEVRRSALLGLADLLGEESLGCAIEALTDRDLSVQLEALYTISIYGTSSVIPKLEEITSCQELPPIVRRAANKAINQIKPSAS
jgi:HEAT repeat protein